MIYGELDFLVFDILAKEVLVFFPNAVPFASGIYVVGGYVGVTLARSLSLVRQFVLKTEICFNIHLQIECTNFRTDITSIHMSHSVYSFFRRTKFNVTKSTTLLHVHTIDWKIYSFNCPVMREYFLNMLLINISR